MRLLLDTHVAIWWTIGSPLLSRPGRELIGDPKNGVFVSVASIWEAAIKNRQSRSHGIGVSARELAASIEAAGWRLVDVGARHAFALEEMTAIHGDPFDRLIVATALADTYRLVTHDRTLAGYGDHVLVV